MSAGGIRSVRATTCDLMQTAVPGYSSSNQSFSFTNNFSQHYTPAKTEASGYTSRQFGLAAALVAGRPQWGRHQILD